MLLQKRVIYHFNRMCVCVSVCPRPYFRCAHILYLYHMCVCARAHTQTDINFILYMCPHSAQPPKNKSHRSDMCLPIGL